MFPGMVSDSADIDDSGTKKALDRIESTEQRIELLSNKPITYIEDNKEAFLTDINLRAQEIEIR